MGNPVFTNVVIAVVAAGITGAMFACLVILVCYSLWRKHPRQWSIKPLLVRRENGIEEMTPVGICGTHVVVQHFAGNRKVRELINDQQCVDKQEFWRAWSHLGGVADGWVDEDGETYRVGMPT